MFSGDYSGTGYDQETLTVSTSSVGFTAARLTDSNNVSAQAVCFTTDQPLRCWFSDNGTAPTATVGLKLPAGGPYILTGNSNVGNARFIRDVDATADAAVNVVFLRG
jgi:hypothetical protein